MINIIGWLLIGAMSSWLTELVSGDQKSKPLSYIIGLVGALSGGISFNLFAKHGSNVTMTDFSISSLMMACICANILLSVMHLFHHRSIRNGLER